MCDEERLLQRLAQALAPGTATPSKAELQVVRHAAAFLREQVTTHRHRLDIPPTERDRPFVEQSRSASSEPPPDSGQTRRVSPARRKPRLRIHLLSS